MHRQRVCGMLQFLLIRNRKLLLHPGISKQTSKLLPLKWQIVWMKSSCKKMARDKNLRPCLPLKPQEKKFDTYIDIIPLIRWMKN